MPSPFVDLHTHSTASDGTHAPGDVARLAKGAGLSAWALTDHDTAAGVAEAAAESARVGIDFLPGIEISAEHPHPGTLHILGYGIDPQSPALRDLTRALLGGRDERNPKIVARLRELGVPITMEEVEREAGRDANPAAVIGRPHIAAILVRKGLVNSTKAAFDKYLAPGGLAYFDKERLSPARALAAIREAGGLPVLAHPVQLRTQNDAQLERIVKDLADLGLAGIEVIHSDHDAAWVDKCERLARKFGLLPTGGSDFHGANKHDVSLGRASGRRVPRAFYEAIVERVGVVNRG